MRTTKIILLLLHLSFLSAAGQESLPGIVSAFMYVDSDTLSDYDIAAFQLKTPQDAPIQWESDPVQPLYQVSPSRFLIKVDVPGEVMEKVSQLECTGIAETTSKKWAWPWFKYKERKVEIPYGGAGLGVIRLEIKSTPKGADVYMVPIRVWDTIFKDAELEKSIEDMAFYKVNTSVTDTFVRIDQTVFKIVFHLNDLFKTIIYRPVPPSVESEQSISITF